MRISRDHVFRLAQKLGGFQPNFLEKSLRLLDVLREVYKHPDLKDKMVLKGGTAINFIQNSLPRLSVDIDFNCLAHPGLAQLERTRGAALSAFNHVANAMKYTVNQITNQHAGVKTNLGYQNIYDHKDHIQVDINFMYRVSLFGEKKVSLQPFPGEKPVKILTLTIEELYGGKINALLDRGAPRDLYDLYKFIEVGKKHNKRNLHQCILIFGLATVEDFRHYDLNRVDQVKDKGIQTELHPTLRKKERPKRGVMVKKVKSFLKDLLQFNKAEKKFIDRFYEGHFEPEIIFSGKLLDHVRNHSGLQWQIKKRTLNSR